MASFSEFDSQTSVQIQGVISSLDGEARRLDRKRKWLLEKSEALQYQILVEGNKVFRSKEDLAQAEKQAAELRRQADELAVALDANQAKSEEAHAQLQNRIADEREAEYERRLGEIDNEIDPAVVKKYLDEEAVKEEQVNQRKAEIADIETRLELLREQEQSHFDT